MAFKLINDYNICIINILNRNLKDKIDRKGVCSLSHTPSSKFKGIFCKWNIDSFSGLFSSFLLIFISFLPKIDLDSLISFFLNLAYNYYSFSLNLSMFPLFSLCDFLLKNSSLLLKSRYPFMVAFAKRLLGKILLLSFPKPSS